MNAVTTVKNTTSRGSATDGSRRGLRRAKAANSSSRRKLLAARIGVLVVAVCLWQMIAGRFISDWREVRTREMDWTALKLMLEGIEPKRQIKRYRLVRNEEQHRVLDEAVSIPSRHADRVVHPSTQCR